MSHDRTKVSGIEITQVAGNCPVEGKGTVDGVPFHFLARGCLWSFVVGADPVAAEWSTSGFWGGSPYDASYMPVSIAQAIVEKAAELYQVSRWDEAARKKLEDDFKSRHPVASP